MKAGMDRKTARKYVAAGTAAVGDGAARDWRTREDPFVEHWPERGALLRDAPGCEAKTLFEELVEQLPGPLRGGAAADAAAARAAGGGRARAGEGGGARAAAPPGRGGADGLHVGDRAGRDDRRRAVRAHAVRVRAAVLELAVGDGVPVGVDGGAATGVQRALFQLGRVPQCHQTDNSTAATHRIPDGKQAVGESDGRSARSTRTTWR